MTADLRAIQNWKTWSFFPTTTEVTISRGSTPAGSLGTASRKTVVIYPYSAVALRMFGKNTDGDTATILIRGYMDPLSSLESGPSQELWYGQVALGPESSSSQILIDGRWGAAATWFDVDAYDISGVSGGHNAANAVVVGGGNNAMLLLPTLGYSHIRIDNGDMDGTGTEMTELGVLYREIAMGGVV